ncbi:DUF4435 domain-containing protein [Pseudomonas sp. SORT22]|uniref:DUF4435 domain-containing protein n=1 Tax=Pseudomonas sp. SORT22 TaxID=2813842 RepID=UPI001BCE07F5|nr:DUF4435 domain-containing protein [Pseudomonas sp. SORT22]QVM98737.1 DUF4435 domain-containing protein [Pseudomonas sp. SORT22]
MELKYDLAQYLTMTKMSSKIRVLVEGKDDRSHVHNLIKVAAPGLRFRVDTAVELVGDCDETRTNNRAKIEKVHSCCKGKGTHKKLFFFCDREFRRFVVGDSIVDELLEHEVDGNLSWSLGHSIENYFLSSSMLCEGFRYLTASAQKNEAIDMFVRYFPSAIRLVASLTVAAKDLRCAGYPGGLLKWQNIEFNDAGIVLKFEPSDDVFRNRFLNAVEESDSIVNATDVDVCSRFCRGHTAVLVLQRVFAACLFFCGQSSDAIAAKYDADAFNNLSEATISSALSEAWILRVRQGEPQYPLPLVASILACA